jgi:hypothetical protein
MLAWMQTIVTAGSDLCHLCPADNVIEEVLRVFVRGQAALFNVADDAFRNSSASSVTYICSRSMRLLPLVHEYCRVPRAGSCRISFDNRGGGFQWGPRIYVVVRELLGRIRPQHDDLLWPVETYSVGLARAGKI